MSYNRLQHFTSSDTRRAVKRALEAGWEWGEYTKGGHVRLRWPATGSDVWVSTSPSDRRSWRWFARDVRKISGVDVTVKQKQKGRRR